MPTSPRILVIGSMNMDLVTITSKMPAIGETILGSGFRIIPGGKGANQAVAAARMGAKVSFIGCVGDDIYGKKLIETLKKEKVNTERITKTKNLSTGIAIIIVDEKGNNTIIAVPGANTAVTVEKLYANIDLIDWCDIMVLQLEIPMETVIQCIIEGKKRNKTIIFNPDPAQELDEDMPKNIDYLVLNEIEARQILKTNEVDDVKLVGNLMNMGFENVLMTVGERGVWFNEKNEVNHIPAFKVNAVDTTAAGDSFIGTFATSLAKGVEKKLAINDAVRAAAITVTRFGAQSSLPYRDEIYTI